MRIETPRLLLRPWQAADLAPWAVTNADPEVRRYYWPAILTPDESDAIVAECEGGVAGTGLWLRRR